MNECLGGRLLFNGGHALVVLVCRNVPDGLHILQPLLRVQPLGQVDTCRTRRYTDHNQEFLVDEKQSYILGRLRKTKCKAKSLHRKKLTSRKKGFEYKTKPNKPND